MRLIDADELKELFREVIGRIAKRPDRNFKMEHMIRASAMVIEMINDAPTIHPEPNWIPVTERLPETTDAVLTTYIVNGDRRRRYVEESSYYWNDESWSSPWDEYRIAGMRIEVIAWMPMPKPYKGD